MALLYMDSFSGYATADIAKRWTSVGSTNDGTVGMRTTGGRDNGASIRLQGSSAGHASLTIPATTSLVFGCWVGIETLSGISGAYIVRFLDGATLQTSLWITTAGTISVVRGTTIVATSTYVLPGSGAYIEFKFTIADSIAANSCIVKADNVEILNVAAGTDIKNTANTTASSMSIGPANNNGHTLRISDLYLCNQSGSRLNDFQGDVRVRRQAIVAAGHYTAGTVYGSGDRVTALQDSTPNTTNGVALADAADRASYTVAALPALVDPRVLAVQVLAATSKSDAGARSAATFVRSSTSDADGTSAALATTQSYVRSIHEVNPATGTDWTEANFNSAEIGLVVTA